MNPTYIMLVSYITVFFGIGIYMGMRERYPYDSKGFQGLFSLFAGFIAALLSLGILTWFKFIME